MFRKAQLKLFTVITSILLAIFIIVLASINIVTSSFMQRQSEEVLHTIASGIEYDEKTDTFSFTPPENYDKNRDKFHQPSKTKPSETTTATTAETTETTTTTATTEEILEETTEETTAIPEETQPEETTAEELPPETDPEPQAETEQEEEFYEETQPEIPEETEPQTSPPETFPPTENQTENEHPDFPPEDERYKEDFPHDDDHRNPDRWWHSDGWRFYNPEEENIFRQSFTPAENIIQLANTGTAPPEKKRPDDIPENIPDDIKTEPVPKSFGSVDFFVIMADSKGNYLACMNNDDLTDENAQAYITEILNHKGNTGMMESYQFYNVEKNNGTLIALTDKTDEKKVMNQFIRTTIIIGALTVILLSFAGYFLSKKSIEPIKYAFEKQKQFISDASHELKTPLTVISANADVLSGEIGNNKWLNYIKSQTERMNLLVNDLLNLTRLENNTSDFICSEFNLSQAVTNTALPFECRAFETNKKFIVNVEDGLTITGSEKHIKQMTAIFIDNALKYSSDGGIVRVTLKKQGDRKILSVYNTGTGVKDSEKDKIFERFYRTDDSRTRQATGGYGLGLAIAKSIIDKHKFKVSVENDEGKSIAFVVTM